MWVPENLTKRINLKSIQVMVCCFHFWQKCCLRCTTWRDFRALNSAYVYKKVFSPSCCRAWKKIKITRHMIKKVRCISNKWSRKVLLSFICPTWNSNLELTPTWMHSSFGTDWGICRQCFLGTGWQCSRGSCLDMGLHSSLGIWWHFCFGFATCFQRLFFI